MLKYVVQVHDYVVGPFKTEADAAAYIATDQELSLTTSIRELVPPERAWKRRQESVNHLEGG